MTDLTAALVRNPMVIHAARLWAQPTTPEQFVAAMLAALDPDVLAACEGGLRPREALEDMVRQFAYYSSGAYHTGGLSALEDAFDALGWDDPHPDLSVACDEPDCREQVTCGTPTPDGYRSTCFDHRPIREAISKAMNDEPPRDFGSQVVQRGGLPKDLAARIDAIEARR